MDGLVLDQKKISSCFDFSHNFSDEEDNDEICCNDLYFEKDSENQLKLVDNSSIEFFYDSIFFEKLDNLSLSFGTELEDEMVYSFFKETNFEENSYYYDALVRYITRNRYFGYKILSILLSSDFDIFVSWYKILLLTFKKGKDTLAYFCKENLSYYRKSFKHIK